MTDELRNRIATIASGFIPLVGRSTIDLADAIMPEIDRRVAEERANFESKFRCVVSHATGGNFQDIDASLNEISVRISQFRTQLWEQAKQIGAKEERERLLERLRDAVKALTYAKERGYGGTAKKIIEQTLAQFEKENSDDQ